MLLSLIAPLSWLGAAGPVQGQMLEVKAASDVAGEAERADRLEELLLSELPRIVTAAAFREQSPEEAPSAVLVVTADDIRSSGARTLGEALERCAGMDLRASDHLNIRGLGQVNRVGGVGDASRILLLVDGVRMNDVFADGFTVGLARGVEDIARIEVIKGPGSALYGTSAFAGVIQVVTLRGSDQPGLEGRARIEGLASQSLAVRDGLVSGAVDLSLYGRAQASGPLWNNPQAALEARTTATWRELTLTAGYSRLASPSMNLQPPPEGNGGGDNSKLSATTDGETQPQGVGAPRFETLQQQVYVALQGEHSFTPGMSVVVRGSASGETMSSPQQGVDVREGSVVGEARMRLRLHPKVWTTAGFEARQEGAATPLDPTSQEIVQLRRQVAGAYLQAEIGPFLSTSLTAGVRVERSAPSIEGNTGRLFEQVSPRAGLVSGLPGHTTVKAFYGRAFQAPSLSMLYYQSRSQEATILPNPDLAPEQIESFEIEAERPLPGRLYARVNLFQNNIKNMIESAYNAAQGAYQFSNSYDATIRGAEAELTWSPLVALQTFGNVTVLDARALSDDQTLPLVPRLRFNAGLRGAPLPRTTAFLSVSYTGAQHGSGDDPLHPDLTLESRLRVDARVAVDLGRRWQVALSVRNLFGSQGVDYAENQLFTTTGAEGWIELTLKPPPPTRRPLTHPLDYPEAGS